MNIRKWKRQIAAAVTIAAILTILPAITVAQATNYQFVAPSSYSYDKGGFFNPSPTNFLFNLSGTFTLNEHFALGEATITNANLNLSGPTPPDPMLPLTSPAGVEAWLESQTFLAQPSIASFNVYQFSTFTIAVDNVSANRLATVSGGIDNRPSDGDAFEFNATAVVAPVVVPEPTCLPICLLLAVGLIAKRGRQGRSLTI